MRIWRTSPAVFMLLLVSFGLFLVSTLGHRAPGQAQPVATDPGGTAITVFTEVPVEPDASMGWGSIMVGVAILCGLVALVLAAIVLRRCRHEHPGRYDALRGASTAPPSPPARAFGLTIADLSVMRN